MKCKNLTDWLLTDEGQKAIVSAGYVGIFGELLEGGPTDFNQDAWKAEYILTEYYRDNGILSADAIPAVTKVLPKLNFAPLEKPATDGWKTIRETVYRLSGKLYEASKRLFSQRDAGEQCDEILRNICDFANLIRQYLSVSHEFNVKRDERLKHSLLWDLKRISKAANELCDNGGMIRWFVTVNEENTAIGGISKDLNKRLYADLWKRSIPTMLTSGTLSVGSDFTALKQSLGLDNKNIRLEEVTHTSPFNYRDNCLIYLSENVPDYRAKGYIEKLTDEIELLINASNGHTAILFTSYKSMRVVHGRLKRRMPDMKDFILERSTSSAIEQYRVSGNGVLFAREGTETEIYFFNYFYF